MILRFGCWLVLLAVCCVALADVEVSTDEVEFENNTYVDNVPLQADDCYCGLFAKSCSYVGGKKKCICDDLYADYLGTCTPCKCNDKYGCKFNSFGYKECKCPKGYVQRFTECQKCDCGEHGTCELYGFGKVCHCAEGYKLKTSVLNENSGICEECKCGDNGGCRFNMMGYKECTCKLGFAENSGTCEACNCSPGDSCRFINGFDKECRCPPGYVNFKGKCKECDCGDNGICTLDEGIKQCDCNPGFSENYRGLCEVCDCKMAESNCTIDGFQKKCQCPKGFKPTTKSFGDPECTDIDECLSPEDNDCPPISTKCVNTRGSYDCVCKEGFYQIYENGYPTDIKEYGCKDIDECLDESPCIHLHTRCVNTPGSYRCECTDGYYLEKDSYGEKYNYCSEDARPWKTASIVLGGVYGFVSLGLLVAICAKHASMG